MGAKGRPRIVRVGANEVEVSANNNAVMLLRNRDVPGMLGKIATIIGKHGCNIANMTLSRADGESTALSVFELDAILSPEALAEVGSVDMVEKVCIVDFQQ